MKFLALLMANIKPDTTANYYERIHHNQCGCCGEHIIGDFVIERGSFYFCKDCKQCKKRCCKK